jgi:hypothetical protein
MPSAVDRVRFVRSGAAAVAAALLLAGCHSGSSSSSAATTGAPTAAAGASVLAGAQQSSSAPLGGSAKANCKQLTDAEVQPLLVQKIVKDDVTAANLSDTSPGQQCVFSGSDGNGTIDVVVIAGPLAAQGYSQDLASESDGPVAVPGIGDKASRDKGDGQVVSIKGDVYCSVTLGSGEDVPGIGALEEAAGGTTHVAESAYQASAEALGTLCNRIYGSGNTTPDLSSLLAADAAASASEAASASPAAAASS